MSIASRRIFALALALGSLAAAAQYPSGGQRRTRPEGQARPEGAPAATQSGRAARAADPVLALERELPSLRADLALTDEQAPLWGPFERSVRDAAELTRQRERKLLAARPVDVPAPNALALITTLADDERQRADAMEDAASRMKVLYESLAPAQRSLFDRRVFLSQSEPLGTR